MSRFWHMLLFFVYVTLASAVGVLAHHIVPGLDPVMSVMIGGMVFLGCALLQESVLRRGEAVKSLRRLLLIKRALDRTREELAVARDETRRLFEAAESGDGAKIRQALAETESLGHRAPPPRAEASEAPPFAPPADPAEAEAHALLKRIAREQEEDEASRRQPASRPRRNPLPEIPNRPAQPDRGAAADRSLRDANAEVRVLHNLVEQLYAGRDKAPNSLSEDAVTLRADARREPRFGQAEEEAVASAAGGGRSSFRVVGGAADPARRSTPKGPEPEILTTIREALRDDRIDLYLQPIVSLPQRKRRFYECYSRIRTAEGDVLGPDRYIDAARKHGLLTAIDNMLLFRCVQLLRKLRRKDFSAAFFCNISPHTLSDREFFRDFIEYMESHAELAPNLVLEFSQADAGPNLEGLGGDLDRLGALGYRFSLDGVSDLELDLDALEERKFSHVKVDSRLVLRGLQQGGADAARLRSLKQALDSRGIDLIVDRIETEATLVELLDFSIDYGQGYLFGEPRLSKDPGGS